MGTCCLSVRANMQMHTNTVCFCVHCCNIYVTLSPIFSFCLSATTTVSVTISASLSVPVLYTLSPVGFLPPSIQPFYLHLPLLIFLFCVISLSMSISLFSVFLRSFGKLNRTVLSPSDGVPRSLLLLSAALRQESSVLLQYIF